jgi:MFS family permease
MTIRPRDHPGYVRFWTADLVSTFGTYVTVLALQVLIVVRLHATATQLGLVSAARWLPYLAFGLIAGVFADRYRRRPILIGTDLGRAALLCLIPLLAAFDVLTIPVLMAISFGMGTLSVQSDAAHQSFLPRLVSRAALTRANARLGQSSAVAQSTGPALAGVLVTVVGAPVAIVVDAVSYLVSGLLLTTVRVDEPVTDRSQRHLLRELREGVSYVYRHPMLAPYALNTHAWFLCNTMLAPVSVSFVLRDLRLSPLALGLAYAVGGAASVAGSQASGWVAARLGVGRASVADRFFYPVSFALVALAPVGAAAWPMIAAGQAVFWLAVGTGNPIEMGYRQAVTLDELQGRMNATIRSINWGLTTIGAPIGGLLADHLGPRPTLWIGVVGFLLVALTLASSRFRNAKLT